MIGDFVYIGIDPSLTHTGMVILGRQGQILSQFPIVTKPAKCWRDQTIREEHIMLTVKREIVEWSHRWDAKPFIFMEDYAPGRFMKTAIPTIELGGLLRLMLSSFDEVRFIPPTVLKQFATGKGNADKMAVAVAVAKQFHVNFGGDDNSYDAMTLAVMARGFHGHTDGLTPAQLEILEKLKGS